MNSPQEKTHMKFIYVKRDFSPYPAGRFISDGPFSGEAFRKLLIDNLANYDRIVIRLDGGAGYPPGFLEEAFGGLVKFEGFTSEELQWRLTLESEDGPLKHRIRSYIQEAKPLNRPRLHSIKELVETLGMDLTPEQSMAIQGLLAKVRCEVIMWFMTHPNVHVKLESNEETFKREISEKG